jgi:hypothetical protein
VPVIPPPLGWNPGTPAPREIRTVLAALALVALAGPALMVVAEKDPERVMRGRACQSLGRVGPFEAVAPFVLRRTAAEKDPVPRWKALRGL